MDLRPLIACRCMLQPDRTLINDEQWLALEPHLPARQNSPGRKASGGNRLFLEAILFLIRTGIPWRDMPRHFGHWNSVYKRYANWAENAVWERVFAVLTGGNLDLSEASLDSSSVRVHQHAAGQGRRRATKPLAALVAVRPLRFTRSRKLSGDLFIFY